MVNAYYKNNVLVKDDLTAVSLPDDITYRRIEGKVDYAPFKKIGCEQTYTAKIRYVVVGVGEFVVAMNDVFENTTSTLISSDTNRERILKEEKLQALLKTNLDRIFKIIYETEVIVSKDECARLCSYC